MATILVVGDCPASREFFITLLGRDGHRVLETSDMAEALRRARAERPDLIICDTLTPAIAGDEFVRQLDAEPALGQTRIIFSAAHSRETARHQPTAEEVLRREVERLQALCTIDRLILQNRPLIESAQTALDLMSALTHDPLLNITLFDFERQRAFTLAERSLSARCLGQKESVGLEAFGDISRLQQGQMLVMEGLSRQAGLCPIHQELLQQGIGSVIHIPMIAQGRLLGALNVGAKEGAAFPPETVELAREVANQLAAAIQRARQHAEAEQHARQLEELVSKQAEQLQEANAGLETFTHSAAHDLRAPLHAMQGFARALQEDLADRLDARSQEYLRRIIEAAQHMNALINDVRAYARLCSSDLPPQTVSLALVMADVRHQFEHEIRERGARVTVEEPLALVHAHYATLTQVMARLLSNALKFTAPGVSPQVRIWTEERTDAVRLWIKDNGIGIASEYHDRIFRAFERLHDVEAYPGTGMGLAIVSKGVERMGGRVGVRSEGSGQGSQFWIELAKATPSHG